MLIKVDENYFDTKSDQKRFYEDEYLKLNPDMHAEDSENKFRLAKQILSHRLNANTLSIVDFGCGNCQVLKKLLTYCSISLKQDVLGIGIDISRNILNQVPTCNNLIKLRSEAENIPLKTQSVDIGICLDLIEHTDSPDLVSLEISRIAKFCVFKIPLERSLYTTIRGGSRRLNKMRDKYGHIHHFNRKQCLSLISQNWNIVEQHFEKIPRRGFFADKLQDMLLRLRLYKAYGSLFGGFIVISAVSKEITGLQNSNPIQGNT